jgi:hypothetical protein
MALLSGLEVRAKQNWYMKVASPRPAGHTGVMTRQISGEALYRQLVFGLDG